MQQRRLRLGDILDDYCPRERRITNHVVVAMIEDEIRQTRCTTCDAEHEYKQAKLPTLRRKKDSVAKAYQEVLSNVTGDATMQAAQAAASPEGQDRAPEVQLRLPEAPAENEPVAEPVAAERAESAEDFDARESENGGDDQLDDQGRVHRRLIRATLPRPENQPAVRPIPQFTMRQPQGRPGGKFRAGGGRGPVVGRAGAGGGGRTGNHPGASSRPSGFRAGAGRAQGARNDFHRPTRGGGAGQPARHGKKHSK
jgi:hypothetical protein